MHYRQPIREGQTKVQGGSGKSSTCVGGRHPWKKNRLHLWASSQGQKQGVHRNFRRGLDRAGLWPSAFGENGGRTNASLTTTKEIGREIVSLLIHRGLDSSSRIGKQDGPPVGTTSS